MAGRTTPRTLDDLGELSEAERRVRDEIDTGAVVALGTGRGRRDRTRRGGCGRR